MSNTITDPLPDVARLLSNLFAFFINMFDFFYSALSGLFTTTTTEAAEEAGE
ncbi:MAG: hypothetical protein LUH40_07430 [Clostridiales bacterium]|nr:hypothetical protein [Clostridiales bacterium]